MPLNEAELEPVQESKSEDEGRTGDVPSTRHSPQKKRIREEKPHANN